MLKAYIYTKPLTTQQMYYKYMIYSKHLSNTLSFFVDKLHPKIVILGKFWSHKSYKQNNSFIYIDESIEFLIKKVITSILIKDVPELGSINPACGLSKIEKLIGKHYHIDSKGDYNTHILTC